ncbi:hypothetical protein [Vibrio mediterranei]|uniref:hypothetical protein n=1 Tax=Vibrio mediterranei TaxID=689 RepID=UPI0022843E44|nr:hypothetical protein [Vibrio mediterranei]MCY9855899.1 hypothetical protein [Vibrio mediterranei]
MNKTTFLNHIEATMPLLSTGKSDDRCWDFFTKRGNVVMLGSGKAIKNGMCEIVWLKVPNFREELRFKHVQEARIPFGKTRDHFVLIRANDWDDNNNVPWEVTEKSVVYRILPETYKVIGDKGYVALDLANPISILEA